MSAPILVAGIGNVFLGDDGFGVEVARTLSETQLPPEVEVADFGIRGFDLAYALMEDYSLCIMVDALPRGESPGTLTVLEPDTTNLGGAPNIEGHAMHPLAVLRLVQSLGGTPTRILIVGCEPQTVEDGMELSPPVRAAVAGAVSIVKELVKKEEKLWVGSSA